MEKGRGGNKRKKVEYKPQTRALLHPLHISKNLRRDKPKWGALSWSSQYPNPFLIIFQRWMNPSSISILLYLPPTSISQSHIHHLSQPIAFCHVTTPYNFQLTLTSYLLYLSFSPPPPPSLCFILISPALNTFPARSERLKHNGTRVRELVHCPTPTFEAERLHRACHLRPHDVVAAEAIARGRYGHSPRTENLNHLHQYVSYVAVVDGAHTLEARVAETVLWSHVDRKSVV